MRIHSMLPLLTSFILCLINSPFSARAGIPGFNYVCSCYEPNYTRSTFQTNLQQLLVDLPRNASQNNYSYNATYGKAPDQVYGLVMCYADASTDECNRCLSEASIGIVECCGLKKNGIAWYNSCLIRYIDVPFNASNNIGLLMSNPKADSSVRESLADPKKFKDVFRKLIGGLAMNASKSALKMVSGTANYVSSRNIYALVQCTRQLQLDECRRCIGDLTDFGVEIVFLNSNSSVIADISFMTVSCYVRFAFHPFYVKSEAHPPWPNSGKRSREPIPTQTFTLILGSLLVLLAGVSPT